MSDGNVVRVEELARYTSAELATVLELEYWRARIGNRNSVELLSARNRLLLGLALGQRLKCVELTNQIGAQLFEIVDQVERRRLYDP